MPVYLYRNLTTGETFEVEQRITEGALSVHPTTGDPVKRLIQPVGIAFKGSGFYVTDSRGTSARGSSASEPKAEGGTSESATPAGERADGAAPGKGSKAEAPTTTAPPPAAADKGKGSAAASD